MRKHMKLIVVGLIFGIILYWAFTSQQPPQTSPPQLQKSSQENKYKPQKDVAPEIVLKDINGQTVKLSDYKGKVVILNFWASWRSPCQAMMPDLDETARELAKGDDAVLLAVNMPQGRETVDKAKKYITDNHFSMPVLFDTEGKAVNDYNITSLPTTFIIQKNGEIYDHLVGMTSKAELMDYVNRLK